MEEIRHMNAEKITQLLKELYNKDTTTQEEKSALLEACGCVWAARMNKVVDVSSFMNMLYEHMGFQYDVEVTETDEGTMFRVKTFMKQKNQTIDIKTIREEL